MTIYNVFYVFCIKEFLKCKIVSICGVYIGSFISTIILILFTILLRYCPLRSGCSPVLYKLNPSWWNTFNSYSYCIEFLYRECYGFHPLWIRTQLFFLPRHPKSKLYTTRSSFLITVLFSDTFLRPVTEVFWRIHCSHDSSDVTTDSRLVDSQRFPMSLIIRLLTK